MTTIHRTDKTGINTFTRIDNRVITDTRLTPLARLALVYLLSKPDDWIVNDYDLRRYLEVGIKKLQSVIQELKNAGYLDRRQRKNENGQWYTTATVIFEHPGVNTVGQKPSNGEMENTVGHLPSNRLPSNGNRPTAAVQYTNNGVTNDESQTTESQTRKEEEEARSACAEFFQNSSQGANAPRTLSKNSNNDLPENEKSAIALLREYNIFETPAMEIIQAQQTTDLDELKDRVERHINAAGGEIALAVWRLKRMIDPPVAALDVDFSKMTCLEIWSHQTKIPAGKARAALKKWAAMWDTREFDATLMAEAICQADEKSKKFDCAKIDKIYCQFDEFSWRADKIGFSYTSRGDEVIRVDYIQHPDNDEKIPFETLPEIAKRKFFRVAVKHLAAKQNGRQ